MDPVQLILAIFGLAITAEIAVLVFMANWHHRTADQVQRVEKEFLDFKSEVAKSYAGNADISSLDQSISSLRTELGVVAADMRKELSEVAKGLNQLIGQASAHRS